MTDDAFDAVRRDHLAALGGDEALHRRATDLALDAGRHGWSYTFDWLGLPIIQHPTDIVVMQEILWSVKPRLVVETGVARGGSLALWASMLELIGGDGVVVGVDVDVRAANRAAIEAHPLAGRIRLVEGSSVDGQVVDEVRAIASDRAPVLVVLDSMHTHAHVRRELDVYAPLVTVGSYVVVFDTIIQSAPDDYFPDRPWGPGDNPATAVTAFLASHGDFELDEQIDAKLLASAARGGYLRRRR